MISLKQLKRLIETKQVGTLYHFTKPENLHRMLDDSLQKEHGNVGALYMLSKNGHISTTRNHELSRDVLNKDHSFDLKHGYSVRIALDGDKISEHHKIKPVLGLKDDEPDIFNHKHNDKYRVSRHSGEREEVIKSEKPFPLKHFIKQIDFVHNRAGDPVNHMDDEKFKAFSDQLSSHGIKHSIGRKWERVDDSHLKENKFSYEENCENFEIIL